MFSIIFSLRYVTDQNSSMCDLWLGFGSPSALSNWGCSANRVPIISACSWSSVSCDSNNCGMVTGIFFNGIRIPGTLSSSLGQLTSLNTFVVEFSSELHGTLPLSVGSLSNLNLFGVTYSSINGTIPSEYNQLTSLTYLALYGNSLSGSIPDIFYNMRSISSLNLDSNVLTGAVPPSVCALTNIIYLYLKQNKLSCYPTCVLNAPNPGTTLPVADPNALIPGGGGATYGSKTGTLTRLQVSGKGLDPAGNNTCEAGN